MYESCLSIHLNRDCFYRFLSRYIEFRCRLPDLTTVPQLYFVNKGGKTVNFRFLNQIYVYNAEMFCFALKILWKCSLKADDSKF